MKRNSIIVGLLVLVFGFSLVFVSGCATDQAVKTETIKSDASMNDILAEETAKSRAEFAAMKKAAEAKKAAEQEKLLAEAAAFADIHFAFDRYDLKPEARNIVGGLADWLSKQGGWVVTIEGHCDERGTNEYNLALGERRAEAAKAYLMSLGIAGERITTISYGEERPLDPASNEEAWAKNRRDHFIVVPKK
ncbi:MAG: peptidoglycan-associated lipoprotein Pal [Deltaproteobacteria bacterium]|nr:peptidoglycan-associated lipoprotein Pal [Deltaproteobacteria bacterium]